MVPVSARFVFLKIDTARGPLRKDAMTHAFVSGAVSGGSG
jgi:hypothetical protein